MGLRYTLIVKRIMKVTVLIMLKWKHFKHTLLYFILLCIGIYTMYEYTVYTYSVCVLGIYTVYILMSVYFSKYSIVLLLNFQHVRNVLKKFKIKAAEYLSSPLVYLNFKTY